MNSLGWIPIYVIARFNRVRLLTPDSALIAEALLNSGTVEVSEDGYYVRRRADWQQWVLPAAERDPIARPPADEGTEATTAAAGPGPGPGGKPPAGGPAPPAAPAPPATPPPAPPAAPKDDDDLELHEDDMFDMDDEKDATRGASAVEDEDPGLDVDRIVVVTPSR